VKPRRQPWLCQPADASTRVGSVPEIDDAPGYAGHRGYRSGRGCSSHGSRRRTALLDLEEPSGGEWTLLLARHVLAAAALDAQSQVPAIAAEALRFLTGEGEYAPDQAGGAVRAFWCHVGAIDPDYLATCWPSA
jgi:hypothetical protein